MADSVARIRLWLCVAGALVFHGLGLAIWERLERGRQLSGDGYIAAVPRGREPTRSDAFLVRVLAAEPLHEAVLHPVRPANRSEKTFDTKWPLAATARPSLSNHAVRWDKGAELVGDWEVQTELWPSSVHAVRIELWISADGVIERWKVLGSAANDPAIAASFGSMSRTLMNPALVHGIPVPSVMEIEIFSGR